MLKGLRVPSNVYQVVDTPYIAFKYAGCSNFDFLDFLATPNTVWVGEGTRKGLNIRKEQFPNYKSTRKIDTRYHQMVKEFWKRLIGYYHLTVHQLDGYEADDVCALYALQIAKEKGSAILYGQDKDFLQLPEQVFLMNNSFDDLRTKKRALPGGKELTGIVRNDPNLFAGYLAVMGDSSDNIQKLLGFRERGDTVISLFSDKTPYKALYDTFGEAFLENLELVLLPHPKIAGIQRGELISMLDKGEYYKHYADIF